MHFTRHARLRMTSRRIAVCEVHEAMDDAETRYDSRYRPDRTVLLGRTQAGRRLKVVLTKDDPPTVITVADRDLEE